jgi:hypothetical protein
MTVVVPAKGEGTAHQLPMPPDSLIISDLILGPSQSMFDLFVTLFNPHSQPIQPDHFSQAGNCERALFC